MKIIFQVLILLLFAYNLWAIEIIQVGRTSFVRNEKNAFILVQLKDVNNQTKDVLWNKVKIPFNTTKNTLSLPIETRLFPGKYQNILEIGKDKFTLTYRIGPQLADTIPVIFWGFKGSHKDLQALGINQGLYYTILDNNPANLTRLNDAIADGFRYYGSVTTNGDWNLRTEYPVLTRQGKASLRSVDASHPKVVERMLKYIDNRTNLRWHPGAVGALLNSEIRAATAPGFAPHNIKAYKEYTNKDIPNEVNHKTGVPYQQLKDFPLNRVVPDNYPILEYYRWFWRQGDGWNNLNSIMANALRKNASKGFICFHDPALRVAPILSSGGKVDALNHWTYGYPEPCRITSHIDGMLEMARCSNQDVWAMTQIISYRSRTTSLKVKPKVLPEWVKKYPKAQYISIPPDNLQEAIWTMISRPIKGMLFHGQATLMHMKVTNKSKGYCCTNDDTSTMMKKMMNEIVHPLGPTLKRLEEAPAKTAILHSFTSSTLANRGTWGWGGWIDDLSLMMYSGGLNPKVIFEENIVKKNALSNIKVLALPHCDVLPESVVKVIKDFQLKGGIVIGDEFLSPAIVPQVRVNVFKRLAYADKTQAKFYQASWNLRREVRRFINLKSETDRPELFRYERKWKNTFYYFVVNDKRSYGNYLGPWKMIMEKGEANKGNLFIYHKNAGAIYELAKGGKVEFEKNRYATKIPLNFNTNDGRIYLVLPSPIAKINLTCPKEITQGEKFTLSATILDQNQNKVAALLPISFKITDTKGNMLDGGPYGCAEDGIWKFETICPLNAQDRLDIIFTDRASGLTASASIKIRKAK